ncbi:hypothetical protein HanRHA438_Chr15g0714961 [Helianthus annuus]|nr:hypothetical protein HanRHA438_Chr15g0714961 [Helianthus annuus]
MPHSIQNCYKNHGNCSLHSPFFFHIGQGCGIPRLAISVSLAPPPHPLHAKGGGGGGDIEASSL